MLSEKIVNLLKEDKLSDAVSLTNNLLYSKLSVAIQEMYPNISSSVFEGKKAPKTDKEDDGEGMDPVGHGDSDIDNDGDVDTDDLNALHDELGIELTDVNNNGCVDIDDLLYVIEDWGEGCSGL